MFIVIDKFLGDELRLVFDLLSRYESGVLTRGPCAGLTKMHSHGAKVIHSLLCNPQDQPKCSSGKVPIPQTLSTNWPACSMLVYWGNAYMNRGKKIICSRATHPCRETWVRSPRTRRVHKGTRHAGVPWIARATIHWSAQPFGQKPHRELYCLRYPQRA